MGYISQILPDKPFTIKCEDESFIWKQQYLEGKSFNAGKVRDIFDYYYKDQNGKPIPFDYPDVLEMADYDIIEGTTLLDIIESLKQIYPITIYWQRGRLKISQELFEDEKIVLFDYNSNIPIGGWNITQEDVVDSGRGIYGITKYDQEVHGKKIGDKVEVWVYKPSPISDKITVLETAPPKSSNVVFYDRISFPNISKEALTKYCKMRLKHQTGLELSGNITTFGEPYFDHGYRARVINADLPDYTNEYDIYKVEKSFGVDEGLRQTAYIKYRTGKS
jgi:hypothetical protein